MKTLYESYLYTLHIKKKTVSVSNVVELDKNLQRTSLITVWRFIVVVSLFDILIMASYAFDTGLLSDDYV